MESFNNLKCRCALCGELLTAPIAFEGKIYGWSCIKKVNPKADKGKNGNVNEYVLSERLYSRLDTNKDFMYASYKGINYLFKYRNFSNEEDKKVHTKNFFILDGIGYINKKSINKRNIILI